MAAHRLSASFIHPPAFRVMIPQSQPRKPRNSSKVNLLISFTFHAVLVVALLYFAAREGLLGKKLKKISIQMVKEQQPPKPKPEPPKVEPPKLEPPKVEPPKMVETHREAAPPVVAPPVVAPSTTELPSFDFDGGKVVETSSDPVQLYKGFVEYSLRSKWNRPDDVADDNYVAEMDLAIDRKGNILDTRWKKSSGDAQWDHSIQEVFNVVKNIGRPPPTNFPPHIIIRFDVQPETEPIMQ